MRAPADVQIPTPPPAPGQVTVQPGVALPQAVYRAFNEQRRELANQLENLEEKHRDLARQLADPTTDKAVRGGLETRVAELDKRIADVDKQLQAADLSVAKAAGAPGAIVPDPPRPRVGPPPEVFVLGGMFIVAVCFPLSIALARRIWKRGTAVAMAFPHDLAERLNRIDQSMDSIAIEVERIGEGQRFVTRVMSESGRALGGAAQPFEQVARGEKLNVPRDSDRL